MDYADETKVEIIPPPRKTSTLIVKTQLSGMNQNDKVTLINGWKAVNINQIIFTNTYS